MLTLNYIFLSFLNLNTKIIGKNNISLGMVAGEHKAKDPFKIFV